MALECDSSTFKRLSTIGDNFQVQQGLASQSLNEEIIHCLHPILLRESCVVCRRQIENTSLSTVRFEYIQKDLRISVEELHRLRISELESLTRKRKLCLVLDLDQTLLHSVAQSTLSSPAELYLSNEAKSVKDDPTGSLFKTQFGPNFVITKLRPYVRTFLEEASKMFDMYVYTHGARPYALAMAELLDPEKKYFDMKVISREDSTEKNRKGLDVVLAPESVVVVLDDTESVWSKHEENLVVIDEYEYFGRKGCWARMDESETNGALARILKKLEHVHGVYYKEEHNDVRKVLKSVRRLVW